MRSRSSLRPSLTSEREEAKHPMFLSEHFVFVSVSVFVFLSDSHLYLCFRNGVVDDVGQAAPAGGLRRCHPRPQ